MENTPAVYLGLDIGFGDVKVVARFDSKNRHISTKFSTAVAYARDGIIGKLEGEGGNGVYNFNTRKYLVGDSALYSRDIFSTRDINFLMEFAPLLAYVAVEKVAEAGNGASEPAFRANKGVCLGIPLAYFHSKHTALANVVRQCAVSGSLLQFEQVEVRAQGQGILFDFALKDDGTPIEDRLDMTMLIVDVGFNTVDILGVVDGRSSREWSGMIERGGVSRICRQVGDYLQREFGFDLPEQSLKDVIMQGQVGIYGVSKDISALIRQASEQYSDWLVQEIRARWDGFLKQADKLIIAGGGAYYVHDDLIDKYPKQFIHVPQAPEYSNARGFLKYLRGSSNAREQVQEDHDPALQPEGDSVH